MKKAIKALFALLFVFITVSGALSAEKKNKPEIMTVDNYIAVFDFEVIDRGNMNKILGEQKFQMSGCVAQECKV
jgi:hypothetical protein